MTPEDERPMADRRELKVSKRRDLQRAQAGTVTPTRKMEMPPKLRDALMTLVDRGSVNPKAKKNTVPADLLEQLHGLGYAHLTMGQKGVVWRATDAGRGWVAATGLLPVFLHRRSELGTTHSAAMGLVSAGEDLRSQSERPSVVRAKKKPRPEEAPEGAPEETLKDSIKAMKARQAALPESERPAA
jgi:hypothetical protein